LRARTLDLFRRPVSIGRPDQECGGCRSPTGNSSDHKGARTRSPVLILDEATPALAPRETSGCSLAGRLAAEGKLVIYISHRLREVRNVTKRIWCSAMA
jgi:ribose transport system ATP-binding protein